MSETPIHPEFSVRGCSSFGGGAEDGAAWLHRIGWCSLLLHTAFEMRSIVLTSADPSLPAVLHLVNSFAEGGTERQAVQLVNALHATGKWNVSVATLNAGGPLLDKLTENVRDGLLEYRLRSFASWHAWQQALRFAARLKRDRVCILHAHGFYPNVFGMIAGTLAGVPIRIASKKESTKLRSTSRARLERFVCSLATRVVANCNAVRIEMLAAGWSAKKIEVIYNAINPDRVAHNAEHDAVNHDVDHQHDGQWHERNRVVVMLANFVHEAKDHDTMLHAARRVATHAPDVRFILAGDGPLRSKVEARAREMHLHRRVTFPGHCSNVGALLARATVCVLASRLEGFPNVILEYMAAERPVVATDAGGVREAVLDGTTGLIVAPGNPQALGDALIALLNDPARAQMMGRAGRARALANFSVSRQVDDVTRLYKTALEPLSAMRW